MKSAVLLLALMTAGDAVRLEVAPRIGSEPQDIRVSVWVDPHADNRSVCVSYDGPQSRTSCWELEGERAPRRAQFWLKQLPAGSYTAWAVLRRSAAEEIHSNRVSFCVTGFATVAGEGCD